MSDKTINPMASDPTNNSSNPIQLPKLGMKPKPIIAAKPGSEGGTEG